MPRNIKLENIENFRDLGGYGCRYGETSFGVIYRSATLARASRSDIDKMASLGIRSIIDLRGAEAQASHPDPMKNDPRFTVYELDVNGNGRIVYDRKEYVESYMEMVEDPESARKILRTIIHAQRPLVIHCQAGKDRTGVFSALLLGAAGVDFDEINADYMSSYPLLSKMTAHTKTHYPEFPAMLLTPDTSFLKEVYEAFKKKYGDFEHYCQAIGLGEDECHTLENLLGQQEKSCGAVVFRDGKVLIEHMAAGHYSIPKGHVEPQDEDEHATARREIKEETSLEVEFIPGFRQSIDYSPKSGVTKQVVFFAAKAKNSREQPQLAEVSSLHWVAPEDAIRFLSYESDRRIVAAATAFLTRK